MQCLLVCAVMEKRKIRKVTPLSKVSRWQKWRRATRLTVSIKKALAQTSKDFDNSKSASSPVSKQELSSASSLKWNSDDNHLLETDNESCGMQTTHNSPENCCLPVCGAVANCLYISDPASNKYSITQRISAWALNEVRVPKASISRLLEILHPLHPQLPLTYKSLLPKPDLIPRTMDSGMYIHFKNWLTTLREILLYHYGHMSGSVTYYLIVNIDGLPLFKHSPDYKLYPILTTVHNVSMRPICVGIYSSEKSSNREMLAPDDFLKEFLEDINGLLGNPIWVNDLKLKLGNAGIYVCDAPVRSSIKSIISHSGYSSCERCFVKGKYDFNSKHISLLKTNCKLRSDHDFVRQTDRSHHKGTSVLVPMGVNMVSDFVLDCMHLCFLGTTRRLLLWWKGVKR